ncbi:calmodulin [Anaeramoeba ignava]|uniref:Calmodulin n=1 Tax=Anaeramoeba ignava TaxID=1746090 RepID=A0A9Q0RAI6_ANAIG|nr:calmodulin [Anaeramoeba ignava]
MSGRRPRGRAARTRRQVPPRRDPPPSCTACRRRFRSINSKVIVMSKPYHFNCLKCSNCQKVVPRDQLKVHQNKFFCAQHAPQGAINAPSEDPKITMEKKVKESFDKIDTNKNGTLDPDEFSKFCEVMGNDLTDWEIDLITRIADQNNDGVITFDEFKRFVLIDPKNIPEDALKKIFNAFDLDGNGTIIQSEFKKIAKYLRVELSKDQIKGIFKSIDTDKSGGISYDEFKKWILK